MISLELVRSGIAFYGLDELSDRILASAEEINGSEQLPVFEKRIVDLYEGDPEALETFYEYHTPDAMFAPGISPDAPLVAAALGAAYHRENVKKYRFDEAQIALQRVRMKDYITYMAGGNNTTTLPWSANMARGILFEVGVLQFQLVREGEKQVIFIHIPGIGEFTEENIRAAVEESRPLVEKYYGLEKPEYICISWLLSPEVHALLGEKSNIYRFYEMFEVEPGEDCRGDVLWNVFGTNDPEAELKEKTSLQRSIKKAFAEGTVFHIGMGKWLD